MGSNPMGSSRFQVAGSSGDGIKDQGRPQDAYIRKKPGGPLGPLEREAA
jgi:hypothetical protein